MLNQVGTEKKAEQAIVNYADMIYRIAFQNLKNRADAEDIFQDVCLAIITKNPPFEEESHLKHWIIRTTINKCKNFHKSPWQSRMESIDDHLDLFAPEKRDVMVEIWQLPKNYRNAIYLYYYESYTIAEIAQIMEKNPNTVSSWLTRAKKKLRNILTESE